MLETSKITIRKTAAALIALIALVLACALMPGTAYAAPKNIAGTYASSATMISNPYAISSIIVNDTISVSPQHVDKQRCNCIFLPNFNATGDVRVSFNFLDAEDSPAGAPSRRGRITSQQDNASDYAQEQSMRNVTFSGNAGSVTIPVSTNFSTTNTIDLHEVIAPTENNTAVLTVDFDDPNAPRLTYLVVMCDNSDNVFITSKDIANRDREWVDYDKANKAPARLSMTDTDNNAIFANLVVDSIKARGNSTYWGTYKKSYRVKLDEHIDMLNQGHPAKKWNLIGMPYDHTLVRNSFSYSLADELGLKDSPQYKMAALYYDGQYRGAYMICETMASGNNRYRIGDPTDAVEDANPKKDLSNTTAFPRIIEKDTEEQDVMGYVDNVKAPKDMKTGYLVELDNLFYYDENCWFKISSGEVFALKEPETASKEQVTFVRDIFQEAYECIEAGGIHPTTHKRLFSYIDVESFVKYFYLQEFGKNVDAFTTSTYFYIPKGETKIYAGPIWDMDDAFASDARDPYFSIPEGWITTHSPLVDKLLKCADFQVEFLQYYTSELRDTTRNTLEADGLLDRKLSEIAPYVNANFMMWEYETQGERFIAHDSYEQSVDAIRATMNDRMKWIDAHLTWNNIVSNKSEPGYLSAAKAFKYTHTSYYRAKWCS